MAIRFGRFRYDPTQRLLFGDGERIPLLPKVADTLHVLLERHGQVVEKAELMRLIWPDATVEEIGLTRNVSLLRKALDDTNDESPIIETIPRRGYRFAAPLLEEAVLSPPSPKPKRAFLIAVALSLFAAAIYYQFYIPSKLLPKAQTSIAVIPFSCLCPNLDASAYPDSLNELLVTRLAQIPNVHVLAPSTVRRHQRAGVSTGLMGRLLGLDAVLEGGIQQSAAEITFTLRLVDVHTGRVIWADTSRHHTGDPTAAQRALVESTALSLTPHLAKPTSP
jgi:DNA-binding winged helix-turn-helix (wHTH) protein/TolB-like protein